MSGADATLTCPSGHDSADPDYCSVCGVRMVDPGAAPTPASSSIADVSAPGTCPNCSTELDPDSRFCEVCGYDPATGDVPDAPPVEPAPPEASDASGSSESSTTAPDPAIVGTWIAVVTADRAYYDRNQVTEVQFPLGMPARTINLDREQASIGRSSRSRGTNPVIDLAGPPEDAAVSHTHASLLPRDDGGWDLVDHASTNGTYLNESQDPIPPNDPQPLTPGDRIYVGAWTKITLELVPEP